NRKLLQAVQLVATRKAGRFPQGNRPVHEELLRGLCRLEPHLVAEAMLTCQRFYQSMAKMKLTPQQLRGVHTTRMARLQRQQGRSGNASSSRNKSGLRRHDHSSS